MGSESGYLAAGMDAPRRARYFMCVWTLFGVGGESSVHHDRKIPSQLGGFSKSASCRKPLSTDGEYERATHLLVSRMMTDPC